MPLTGFLQFSSDLFDNPTSAYENGDEIVIFAQLENGTAEIIRLADLDTVKSNIFAKTAIRFVQSLPEVRLLKSVVVPFEMDI